MVLGVFPQNLDEIEFWTVRGQIEQEEFVLGLPASSDFWVDILVDRGVVQRQKGEFARVRGLGQEVKKGDDVFSPDVMFAKREMQFSLGVIQGAQGIDPLAAEAGVRRVGVGQRRPAALNIG